MLSCRIALALSVAFALLDGAPVGHRLRAQHQRAVLESDGWIVKPVQSLENPFPNAPKRFDKVLTKMWLWRMTEYERIVFIDADALVLR